MSTADAQTPADLDRTSLQAVLDSAPDAGFLVGPDFAIAAVGRHAADVLWGPPATWVGRPAVSLVAADHVKTFERRLRDVAARAGSRAAGFVTTVVRADGSTVSAKVWLSEVASGSLLLWVREQERPGVPPALGQEISRSGDTVLQAVASATYAHQRGDREAVDEALREAAAAAQQMTTQLYASTARRTRADRAGDAGTAAAATARTPDSPSPEDAHTDRVRIVLADDTAAIRSQLHKILLGIPGVEIVGEAKDGEEAVELALDLRPELLLVDLSMPKKSGFEVIAEVRAAAPTMKIVALSGFSRETASMDALQHGATAYLEKGGAVGRFASLIDDLFPMRDRSLAPASPAGPGAGRPVSAASTEAAVPEQRSSQQSDLVSVYAHELRSPITAQMMALELLMDERGLPAHAWQLLEKARNNTVKMNRLVQTLCDANRVGAGNLNLVVSPVDLSALVRSACDGIDHVVDPHRLALALEDETSVAVDAFRVKQVVENLISNAAKFGPDTAPIMVTARRTGGLGVVEVSDMGAGIAPENRERLFQRFQRLGASAPGIGLGMYLSREIARAHGGDLAVVDGPTCGATFRLSLPTVD